MGISKQSIVPERISGSVFMDEYGKPYSGDHFEDGVIYRFRNGKLHGGDEAAVERDTHLEYWFNGCLHGNPAIIDEDQDFEAEYKLGVFIASRMRSTQGGTV